MKNFKKTAAALFIVMLLTRGTLMANAGKDGAIREVLENGVTVIIKENHSAPVAACNFWVRAGAAHENDSEKGLSHFLEHMMFKGTEKRGLGMIDKEIKDLGGYNNAFTSYDATNYVIVLPSEHVNRAIDIEYDALTGSLFDEKEINKEREVVLDELYKGKDNPSQFLWQKLMKLNFNSRYDAPIIGYDTNLKGYTRQSVLDYYKKYYVPGNMVVVISGDVDAAKTLAYVKQTFGQIEPKKTGSFPQEQAAETKGFKYEAVSGTVESRYLAIGFRIPDVLSKDTPKLEILARVLGGSESSVLYQALKEEKELVDEIDADMFSGKFGGIFVISATVRQGKYEETLKAIFEELNRVKAAGIRADEVNKVKSDIIREKAREDMKVENAAMELGYYESLSNYAAYYEYYDRLKRVIEGDLLEAMEKYLNPEAAGMVLYYPEKNKDEFKKYLNASDVKKLIEPRAEAKKSAPAGELKMAELKNGIKFIHKKLDNTDIVAVKFVFTGGVLYEGSAYGGSVKGITNLMQEVMMKGTDKLGAKEVAEQIDRLGAVLSKDISKDRFGWSAEVVSGNFGPFMELLAGIILKPAFELKEIKKEKEDIINSINRLKDNPAAYCAKIYNEEFFEWHPYGFFIPGTPETIKGTPSKYLKEWHDRYLTPNNLIVTVIGNVDFDMARAVIEKEFTDWQPGNALKASLPVKITLAKKERRETIEKNQSHIMIGFLGPKTNSEEYFAFRLLDVILSGGMDSRLFTEIRDKKNLCYTIYSNFDRYIENGSFKIYVATSPENEKTVIEEVYKLLRELKEKGVTDQEVKSAKAYLNGMFKIGFQDFMGQADSYSMYEFWGMGYKKVDTFLDEVFKVKKADINKVINKYINFDESTQVVVGPALKKK